jgi:hypothetical protein
MSQIIKPIDNYKQFCDAFSCEAEATEQIEVSAGKHGFITLFVCKNCISKFVDGSVTKERGDK